MMPRLSAAELHARLRAIGAVVIDGAVVVDGREPVLVPPVEVDPGGRAVVLDALYRLQAAGVWVHWAEDWDCPWSAAHEGQTLAEALAQIPEGRAALRVVGHPLGGQQ